MSEQQQAINPVGLGCLLFIIVGACSMMMGSDGGDWEAYRKCTRTCEAGYAKRYGTSMGVNEIEESKCREKCRHYVDWIMNSIEESSNTIVEIDLTNPKQSSNSPVLNALFRDGYVVYSQLAIERNNKPVMLLFLKQNKSTEVSYRKQINILLLILFIQTLFTGASLWM